MNLDTFDSIKTLEELRSFIPELGESIKTFAASRNDRYRDPNSFRWVHMLSKGLQPVHLVNQSVGCEQTHRRSDNLHCASQRLHAICD